MLKVAPKKKTPNSAQLLLQQLQTQAHQFYLKGELEKSLALYQQVLFRDPYNVFAYSNLGVIFSRMWKFDMAAAFFEKALSLDENDITTLCNYSNCLQKQERLEEAIQVCDKALSHAPHLLGVLLNKALSLRKLGRFDEALEIFSHIVRAEPLHADSHFNIGVCLLYKGNWAKAWPEYEWRWKMRETKGSFLLQEKRWAGEPLKNKTLLLYNEQGFGDTIQMIRYAPLLQEKGAKVIVKCQPSMVRLLKKAAGVSEAAQSFEELEEFDYQSPLFSLPYLCGTLSHAIPSQTPYISVNKLGFPLKIKKNKKINIGLAWSTSQSNLITRSKSIPLQALLPLLDLPHTQFYSLQVDAAKNDLYTAEIITKLVDLSPEISDFYDTAQIMQELDLVISVDTSVAHLAGALNRPVWTLIPHLADWRWGLKEPHSAWYPSMRLFRQEKRGEWEPVIKEVRQELEILIKQKKFIGSPFDR